MDQIQHRLDKSLGVLEQGLNIAGYIPIVSTFSGSLRAGYGKWEIIGAVATGALLAVKALFAENRDQELNKAIEITLHYSLHGGANILRGIIEILPFVSLVTCLPYDLLGYRFSYLKEDAQPLSIGTIAPLGS